MSRCTAGRKSESLQEAFRRSRCYLCRAPLVGGGILIDIDGGARDKAFLDTLLPSRDAPASH
ncbi:hypothetical protein ANDA3_1347 [plant metagenome]|uniref:Uncharacterized protein n=1 Tax=plant metagenome TaxID=1297885 RepID=A0A484VDJ8_9ZZZZ